MKRASSKSIRAVIKNISDKERLDFQQTITRYLHERLLYRVSISAHRSNFILKGGNLMYVIEGLHTRPTIDIDMLSQKMDNDKESLKAIFKEICDIHYADDCVVFNSSTIKALDIAEEKRYSGVRLLIEAQFDTIRQNVQIDFGFGDVITPAPVALLYPVLLDGLDSPSILTYSAETVIAEKFEAMIQLGELNSRMKDFFDVYILLKNNRVDTDALKEAIFRTFERRKTILKRDPAIFTDDFYLFEQRKTKWGHFLKKIKAEHLDFTEVIQTITATLQPIYQTMQEVDNKQQPTI